MKKLLTLLTLMLVTLTACNATSADHDAPPETTKVEATTLAIVASNFPLYDFTRQIAGDKAEVHMLIAPGADTHHYEPSTHDIIQINNSDMFVYTGPELEQWANKILDSLDQASLSIVDTSLPLALAHDDDDHDHDDHDHDDHDHDDHDHDDHDHDDHDHDDHDHDSLYDPHIWTDPIYVKMMVDYITEALCEIDPDNASYYRENVANYHVQLDELDAGFRQVVAEGNRDEMVFGGRFAFYHFAERYDLDYVSAYDSCFGESEPSTKVIMDLIEKVRQENVPVIYYEELSTPRVSQLIHDETGAKMLVFRACHNVSREEFENGVTYYELMKENIEHLKEGLQ